MGQYYLFENDEVVGISNDPIYIEKWESEHGPLSVMSCDVYERLTNENCN